MAAKWLLKSCPKCGGDMYQDGAWSIDEAQCLQCGHILTSSELEKLGVRKDLTTVARR